MVRSDRYLTIFFLVILYVFFASIMLAIFSERVLSRLTKSEVQSEVMGELKETTAVEPVIWSELYPFEYDKKEDAFGKPVSVVGKYKSIIKSVESKIDLYTSKFLIGYDKMVYASNAYEELLSWNFASYSEYNGVVKLPDGYLTSYTEQYDTAECAQSLAKFAEYCKNFGSKFLYVQAPCKISQYQDTGISGKIDFANQNCDEFLESISKEGIDYLDLRESIKEAAFNNHELFFRTDHHWQPTTGLWAAQKTLKYCNEKYGYHADISRLDENKFNKDMYKGWFLGSEGKKLTLARTEPDDFYLMYPDYETKLHYEVVDIGLNKIGDYSVIYDMNRVESKDLYNQSPYHAYNWGDRGLIKMDNLMKSDDHDILIIHDSFGDVYTSCIGLCEKHISTMNLAVFDGSVMKYIEQEKPNLVIVLYYAPGVGVDIKWNTHKETFDFR